VNELGAVSAHDEISVVEAGDRNDVYSGVYGGRGTTPVAAAARVMAAGVAPWDAIIREGKKGLGMSPASDSLVVSGANTSGLDRLLRAMGYDRWPRSAIHARHEAAPTRHVLLRPL